MAPVQPSTATPTDAMAGWLVRGFALLGLILYSEGFLGHFFGVDPETDRVSPLRYIWPPLYLLTVLAVLPHLREMGRVIAANRTVALVVLLCLVSTAWSIDPEITLRRSIALAATTLFGFWLVVRFTPGERLRLFAWTFGVLAVGSLLLALLLPQYGIMSETHPGAWSGAFSQKNKFGQMMVFGAAVFTVYALVEPGRWLRACVGALLCAALVFLSTSVTSLIALTMAGLILVAVTVLLRNRVVAVLTVYASVAVAIAVTLALMIDPNALFGLFGRDASLTGRTSIWEPLWASITERPWLGYGYGAFWEASDGPAWYIRRRLEWDVPSAHNGWVELWLDAGIFAVLGFAAAFGAAVVRTVRNLLAARGPEPVWALLFLCLFLIFSLSESSILRQNNLTWVLYVATVAGFALKPRREPAAKPLYTGMAASPRPAAAYRPPA